MAESVIYADNTTLTINTDSTERTLFTTTIGANTLAVADALRVSVWGNYRNDVGSSQFMTFRFYFGAAISVVVRDSQTAAAGLRDAFWSWLVTMRSATNAQYVLDEWCDGAAGNWAATPPATDQSAVVMDFAFGGNNLVIDTTASQTLKMTGQLGSSNANLEMTYYAARIEQITLDPVGGGGAGDQSSHPKTWPWAGYRPIHNGGGILR